jgi:DNA-directed RNA polymerase
VRENHACFDTCPPEALRTWRITAGRLYDKQTSLTTKRLQCAKILYLADRYAKESAFWYPHQLDFRGRAYPMPANLTPQGTDLAKGLLTFAEGKPIGEQGWRWLAIHLANCAGEDKISLDDRIAWVLAHEERILSVAADPFGPDFAWWTTDADKPFQFLAACLEWAGWKAAGQRFLSHLPVAMDGTCNGLQIFSLMLRDETGGHATNLLPADKPQDIYGIVAEKVVERLKDLTETGGSHTKIVKDKNDKPVEKFLYDEKDMAGRLLALGINRKTTKRQVMVVPYGGTQTSCREYTLSWLDERIAADPEATALFPEQRDAWNAMLLLSGLIWKAIDETVVAAREAMRFLQKLASLAAGKDLPITWTTPLGFPVLQAYQAYTLRCVTTKLFGRVYQPKIAMDAPELDHKRQRNGVSPNYVHSLDAAAMQHTICLCLQEGVTSFAMIHDSYATHAVDAEILARSLRNSFVDLFGGKDNNLLAVIRSEVARQTEATEAELPDIPPCGTLDVNAVQDSLYFFA